ncbi:uncharacterized protein BP01DRAFT_94199 [Aspergillus saccharolyticus JOP 1030-1]|uniref:Uncharacterized protein n=1 Tax=Aspergillus saccharolyticus JOP 1030-1 TaxID=1450539 RepID=A0A318ZBH7_9EURO|nr:hypothetical protein BP01DRAFT_94199 [Aspergillus saccharolyticus JOP 1030-1]PYH43857.1 hypothetical protein BP01DRAFT_94199 [Aspergillus saccharolyticus JOP 1030-1]
MKKGGGGGGGAVCVVWCGVVQSVRSGGCDGSSRTKLKETYNRSSTIGMLHRRTMQVNTKPKIPRKTRKRCQLSRTFRQDPYLTLNGRFGFRLPLPGWRRIHPALSGVKLCHK